MNRINQNNQLFSKSLFDDRQINYFLRNRHEKKVFFRSSSTNRNNRLRYKTKIDHEIKKIDLKIVFDRVRRIRKKSHLSNVAFQRDHLSCLVYYLNQEKTFTQCRDFDRNIVKTIDLRINQFFDEKTSFKVKFDDNSHFDSDFSINSCVAFVLVISHWINTFFSDCVSTTSLALNSLKRHFELRYRLSFSDSLSLLIMKCMQNVTNFQQNLKSRSYKEIMNDLSRNEWLKVMKNCVNKRFYQSSRLIDNLIALD